MLSFRPCYQYCDCSEATIRRVQNHGHCLLLSCYCWPGRAPERVDRKFGVISPSDAPSPNWSAEELSASAATAKSKHYPQVRTFAREQTFAAVLAARSPNHSGAGSREAELLGHSLLQLQNAPVLARSAKPLCGMERAELRAQYCPDLSLRVDVGGRPFASPRDSTPLCAGNPI